MCTHKALLHFIHGTAHDLRLHYKSILSVRAILYIYCIFPHSAGR